MASELTGRDLDAAVEMARIVMASPDNEATAYPWWAIVQRAGFGRFATLAGPFFSRDSAERQRQARIYEYGQKSLVYCFSGHESRDYRELRKAARAALEATDAR